MADAVLMEYKSDAVLLKYPTWSDRRYKLWPMLKEWITAFLTAKGAWHTPKGQILNSPTDTMHYNAVGEHRPTY